MALPIREQALVAVRTALETGLVGVTVHRNRTARISVRPSANLLDGGMTPNDETLGFTRYALRFAVQGYIETADDELLGPAMSELQAAIVTALLGNVTLGGVVVDVHEGETTVEVDRAEGRLPGGVIETEFTVDFFTAEGNPRLAGP